MYPILFILLNSLLFRIILCYPGGAPSTVCDSMTPNHGSTAQQGASPFTVKVEKSYYTPGNKIPVMIESSGSDTFLGILVQAREVGKNMAIGTFTDLPSKIKHVSCNSNAQGAVTHKERLGLKNITLLWSPPSNVSGLGNISFFATVVKNKATFWVKLQSPELYKMIPPMPFATMAQSVRISQGEQHSGTVSVMETMSSKPAMPVNATKSSQIPSTSMAHPTECPANAKCGGHAFVPDSLLLLFSIATMLAAAGYGL